MDARTPRAAAAELLTAVARFEERTGGKASIIYTGVAAEAICQAANGLNLLPNATKDTTRMFFMSDKNLPVWDMLLTGDEPKEPSPL